MIRSAIALGGEDRLLIAPVCRSEKMFPFWNTPVIVIPVSCSDVDFIHAMESCIERSCTIENVDTDERRLAFLKEANAVTFDELERTYKLAIVTQFPEKIELSLQQPALRRGYGFVAESSPEYFSGALAMEEVASKALAFLRSPAIHHRVRKF
ncbi:MAG: hypothetical protein ACK5PB_09625 [Pirellula sp.]